MLIEKIEVSEITEFTKQYYNFLTSPMDDMYEEEIMPTCIYYKLTENEICGYVAVNKEGSILQFYLIDRNRKDISIIFKKILNDLQIKKALVNTNDPLLFNLCKELNSESTIHDYMFREDRTKMIGKPINDIEIFTPTINDLDKVLEYFKSIDMSGDFINNYIDLRISSQSIYLFKINNKIIGTGEIRPSKSSPDFANVGMTVSKDFRKKGVGTYILSTLRTMANIQYYKAICSTDVNNKASYNTIIKSGFECYHMVYEFIF